MGEGRLGRLDRRNQKIVDYHRASQPVAILVERSRRFRRSADEIEFTMTVRTGPMARWPYYWLGACTAVAGLAGFQPALVVLIVVGATPLLIMSGLQTWFLVLLTPTELVMLRCRKMTIRRPVALVQTIGREGAIQPVDPPHDDLVAIGGVVYWLPPLWRPAIRAIVGILPPR